MSESLLKKDFDQQDVARIRNIVTNKYGNRTGVQVGYDRIYEDRKEGEIWEEGDKIWTIKNGLKQTYTKLDLVKEMLRIPFACPKCSKAIKHRFDKKMYYIQGCCFDCVVRMESKLKREGKYEEYVKNKINGNLRSFIHEAKEFILNYADMKDDQFLTEQGDIENWEGNIDRKKQATVWLSELEELENKLEN